MIVQYKKLPSELIKYLILAGIIFCLLLVIPDKCPGIKESVVLTVLVTVVVAIIEQATFFMSESQNEKFDMVAPVDAPIAPTPQIEIKPEEPPVVVQPSPAPVAAPEVPEVPHAEKATEQEVYKGDPNAASKESKGSRAEDDVILDETKFNTNQPHDFPDTADSQGHHVPLGDLYKPSDFEYGYSFLPPEKWYTPSPYPPMCIAEKRCPVCPVFTTGSPIDVKEWNASRRVTQPDGINTSYVKEKLNSGR